MGFEHTHERLRLLVYEGRGARVEVAGGSDTQSLVLTVVFTRAMPANKQLTGHNTHTDTLTHSLVGCPLLPGTNSSSASDGEEKTSNESSLIPNIHQTKKMWEVHRPMSGVQSRPVGPASAASRIKKFGNMYSGLG